MLPFFRRSTEKNFSSYIIPFASFASYSHGKMRCIVPFASQVSEIFSEDKNSGVRLSDVLYGLRSYCGAPVI